MQLLPICLLRSTYVANLLSQRYTISSFAGAKNESFTTRRLRWLRLSAVTVTSVTAIVALPLSAFAQESGNKSADQAEILVPLLADAIRESAGNQYYWVGPLAIVLSAIGAWYFAHRAIEANKQLASERSDFDRDIQQKRATFDYMSQIRWDEDFIAATRAYLLCTKQGKDLTEIVNKYEQLGTDANDLSASDKELIELHDNIKRLLNEYEAIAVGIQTGALSEQVVRSSYGQAITAIVNNCKSYIEKTREYAGKKGYSDPSKIYTECQKMTTAWTNGGDYKSL